MQVTFLSIVKAICDKSTANILKKLKAFPIKSGIKQGCPRSLNTVIEFLATAKWQDK
jgi:hypothetical protein